MSNKYNSRYWSRELQRADAAHKDFIDSAKESIKAYSAKSVWDKVGDVQRRRNVWWYVTETLLPAYFSRTPKIEAELRKRTGAPIYQLACRAIERECQYGLDEFFDFDLCLESAARSLLLTGRSVLWVRYEAAVGQKEYKHKLKRAEDGLYYPDGVRFDGDEAEVSDDGEYVQVVPAKQSESAVIESINYADFRTGPGRSRVEMEWLARKAWITKEQFKEKFGEAEPKGVQFNAYPQDLDEKEKRDEHIEGKACIWEIWCESSGKVYHKADGGDWYEASDPPLEFEDFYPCDILQANQTPDSCVPVSDWEHVKDQILEVEQLTTRKFACLRAIRSNFAFDANMKVLEGMLEGDLKALPVKNWPNYKGKGGLASSMEFLNVEPYVRALEVINLALNEALQGVYETTKAADILRGMADPRETATAVEIRSDWGSMGLRVRQRMFARHVSNVISKFSSVIISKFSPEQQLLMMDIESLARDLQKIAATPQQLLAAMADNTRRNYALEISSDSMTIIDERAESQDRAEAVEKIGGFLNQTLPFMQQFPTAAPQLMQLLEFVTRTMKAGKDVEPIFLSMFQAIISDVQAAKSAPPPPDPAIQVAQIDAQTKQQQMQIDAQLQQVKAQAEFQRAQMDAQSKAQEMALRTEELRMEQTKLQVDMQLRQQELALKAQELGVKADQAAVDQILQAKMDEFDRIIEQQRVDIERRKASIDAYEKLLEEKRLAIDTAMRQHETAVAARQAAEPKEQPKAAELPPINIQVDAGGKSTKRKARIIRGKDGKAEGVEYDDGE